MQYSWYFAFGTKPCNVLSWRSFGAFLGAGAAPGCCPALGGAPWPQGLQAGALLSTDPVLSSRNWRVPGGSTFPWGQVTALEDFPLFAELSILQSPEPGAAAAAPRWSLQLGAPSCRAHGWKSLLAQQQLPALGGKGVLGMLGQAQRQGTLQENNLQLVSTAVTIFQLLCSFCWCLC